MSIQRVRDLISLHNSIKAQATAALLLMQLGTYQIKNYGMKLLLKSVGMLNKLTR
ncbi:hypothetical protein [Cuspidothrix issatschenkoi]|jgi:hypothetical protein|uniref:hypothetical protein n=1 Tax=Cuspidothrix issatschenkoi TaxID=230752 RepID=UPI001A9C6BBE|nr:hypothetical protein [Cuspidothrix issatschenkoi]